MSTAFRRGVVAQRSLRAACLKLRSTIQRLGPQMVIKEFYAFIPFPGVFLP